MVIKLLPYTGCWRGEGWRVWFGLNSFAIPSSAVGFWQMVMIQCTLKHSVVALGMFGGNSFTAVRNSGDKVPSVQLLYGNMATSTD